MCILEDAANECAGRVCADLEFQPLSGLSLGMQLQVLCLDFYIVVYCMSLCIDFYIKT